ncbi:MAG TPA: hypothetical protein VHZ24_17860 [Pirellulales bacterium]|nr:hypothetical protein [Pirellulales bacterium]
METEFGLDAATADETSRTFLGQWQRLVSTTNWEKGRIIHEWREALVASGASSQQYSDEAWSRRVGHVSSQHAGRLRRVYERFHQQHETFAGLYWSHFQAALDWNDAELWLEGAVQNDWSISQMRAERYEAFGGTAPPSDETLDESAEVDEDYVPTEGPSLDEVRVPGEPAADDSAASPADEYGDPVAVPFDASPRADEAPAEDVPSPFESLRQLPDDLAEAFESFKLAILRHKLSGWQEVSCSDVLASLDALKFLATSPAG